MQMTDTPSLPPYYIIFSNRSDAPFNLLHYGVANGKTHQAPKDILAPGDESYLSWNLPGDISTYEKSGCDVYWKAGGNKIVGFGVQGFNDMGGIAGRTSYQYTVLTNPDPNAHPPGLWIQPTTTVNESYSFGFLGEGNKQFKMTVAPYSMTEAVFAVCVTFENWD